MRDLLPQNFGGRQRHEFFIKNLRGIEIDPFSIEVARMCLMLADFPESNGWEIAQSDAFADSVIENASKKSMILVANPPFEKIKIHDKARPKPLEFLRRFPPEFTGRGSNWLSPAAFVLGQHCLQRRKEISAEQL